MPTQPLQKARCQDAVAATGWESPSCHSPGAVHTEGRKRPWQGVSEAAQHPSRRPSLCGLHSPQGPVCAHCERAPPSQGHSTNRNTDFSPSRSPSGLCVLTEYPSPQVPTGQRQDGALVTPDGTCCLCAQPRSHGHPVWSTTVHSHATGQVHVGGGRALGTGNLGPNVVLLGTPRS